jgi:hypothetical protein
VLIQVGLFADRTNAEHAATGFDRLGTTEVVARTWDGRALYVIQVASFDPQSVVAAAMAAGLPGTIITRQ